MSPDQKQQIREKFRNKFGRFYISIDSKTKAIRIVDIENGIKVNGQDGSLIECVASGDIEKFLETEIDLAIKQTEERIVEKIEDGFSSFTLKDWSGETEVYDEMDRLKESIINLIKNNEIQSN